MTFVIVVALVFLIIVAAIVLSAVLGGIVALPACPKLHGRGYTPILSRQPLAMDAQVVTWKQIAKRKGFSHRRRAGIERELAKDI